VVGLLRPIYSRFLYDLLHTSHRGGTTNGVLWPLTTGEPGLPSQPLQCCLVGSLPKEATCHNSYTRHSMVTGLTLAQAILPAAGAEIPFPFGQGCSPRL